MIIERADINLMRDVAIRVMNTKSSEQIRLIERDFVAQMSEKYGKKRATEMLARVWNMSKAVPSTPEDSLDAE